MNHMVRVTGTELGSSAKSSMYVLSITEPSCHLPYSLILKTTMNDYYVYFLENTSEDNIGSLFIN